MSNNQESRVLWLTIVGSLWLVAHATGNAAWVMSCWHESVMHTPGMWEAPTRADHLSLVMSAVTRWFVALALPPTVVVISREMP
jgi:hypothetical protein